MLAKAIKSDPLLAGTRLVMMTSLDRQEDASAMRAAGLDAYLTKPVKHTQLFDSLTKVMGNETRPPSAPAGGRQRRGRRRGAPLCHPGLDRGG